jgi:hypothetical protein
MQNTIKPRSLVIISSLLVNRQMGENMLGNSFGWNEGRSVSLSRLTILEDRRYAR